jgi:regulator of RNase E activity RraA
MQFDTPTVWNALESYKLRSSTTGFTYPGLVLRTPNEKPMVGYAVTAKICGCVPATEDQKPLMFTFFENIRAFNVPSIAVMEDIDTLPVGSFWGEVQATTCLALGAAGTLTQGGVRDLKEVASLGFYFFSTSVMVARAESHIVEVDCPVQICGMEVKPGDLIHADCHGAVTIPSEAATTLAEACRRVSAAERYILDPVRKALQAGEKPTVEQIRQWRAEMSKHR